MPAVSANGFEIGSRVRTWVTHPGGEKWVGGEIVRIAPPICEIRIDYWKHQLPITHVIRHLDKIFLEADAA